MSLDFHGDAELAPGLIDLAVNVRLAGPPPWLRAAIAGTLDSLGSYPDPAAATAAVAARHRRPPQEVLLTAGAAEAFTLVARALPGRAVVVHPQFTEPDRALRAAGRPVHHVLLPEPFRLDPALVPEPPPGGDLVVVGNPTNPTSVLHPAATLAALRRPGRTLVVDEAFADAVPGEPASLAAARLPGVLVVRSLTKTWGLAGLRAGYLLGEPTTIDRLRAAQPPWAVSSPALAAAAACSTPAAVAEGERAARRLAPWRAELADVLGRRGLIVVPGSAGPFLLARGPAGTRQALRERKVAVRRGETFPGLGPEWFRVAVRDGAAQVVAAALDPG